MNIMSTIKNDVVMYFKDCEKETDDNLLTIIKDDISKYLGVYVANQSDLGFRLTKIVSNNSAKIYEDESLLRKELVECKISEMDIYKVLIMTKVTGFHKFLEEKDEISQIDLDVYIQNALKETNLNRQEVLRLCADIFNSLNGVFAYNQSRNNYVDKALKGKSYVIPNSTYIQALRNFDLDFKNKYQNNGYGCAYTKQEYESLKPLVGAKIPKAQYYMGYSLLNSQESIENNQYAIELLNEAFEGGELYAALTLGDFYYDQGIKYWQLAYDFYTAYGVPSLSKERKYRMKDILYKETYNRKILLYSLILLIVIGIFTFVAPGSNVYATHYVIGTITFIIDVITFVFGCMSFREYRYQEYLFIPTVMVISWFVYMSVRIIM